MHCVGGREWGGGCVAGGVRRQWAFEVTMNALKPGVLVKGLLPSSVITIVDTVIFVRSLINPYSRCGQVIFALGVS